MMEFVDSRKGGRVETRARDQAELPEFQIRGGQEGPETNLQSP